MGSDSVTSISCIMGIIYKKCSMIFELPYNTIFVNYMNVTHVLTKNGLSIESTSQLVPWSAIRERLLHREDLCEPVCDVLCDIADANPSLVIEHITGFHYTERQLFSMMYERILCSPVHEKMGLLRLMYILAQRPDVRNYIVDLDMVPLTIHLADICIMYPNLLTHASDIIRVFSVTEGIRSVVIEA